MTNIGSLSKLAHARQVRGAPEAQDRSVLAVREHLSSRERAQQQPAGVEFQVIILAAGKGSRMGSDLPKVMHKIGDKTMLEIVVDNCSTVTDDLVLVYSSYIGSYVDRFADVCKLAFQEQQLGTGHAAYCAIDHIDDNKQVAIIFADNPLITSEVIKGVFGKLQETKASITLLAFNQDSPNQCGRVIINQSGHVLKIVEMRDASEEEKNIKLCNSGIMAFAPGVLRKYLPLCLEYKQSNQEYYLTTIIEAAKNNDEVISYHLINSVQALGVNTQEELLAAREYIRPLS